MTDVSRQPKGKRVADVCISVALLALITPLMLVPALMIPLDSRGPVFYRQERVGLGGCRFNIIKLRTMSCDAEAAGPTLAVPGDSRITRIGRWLRRYHLDELPQLWNVIRGEMALIGPRPERPVYVERIIREKPDYQRLFAVRPGITSPGMVNYGYASTIVQMIERSRYDLRYLSEMSPGVDMQIMLRTIKTVFSGKGV